MIKLSAEQAHVYAIEDAKEDLLAKVRAAVHTQKIAEHLSLSSNSDIFVSDTTWKDQWDDIVESTEYLDHLLTFRWN